MYGKNNYNIVIGLQPIKINGKKRTIKIKMVLKLRTILIFPRMKAR